MAQLEEILKEYWNHESFRPGQKEIIESVLAGKDTLAILPTGGGKSICFQVPALAREGICIVVSPLIALMKDQVEHLKKRGIPALMIHSGMSRRDVELTLKNAGHDYFKFIYVSPERLETTLFREYLPGLNVNMIAVDEAHCISQWGYDFRPSYLRIAALREELPNVPVLALTASATPDVETDICEKLQLHEPSLFRQSFERKNLSYSAFLSDAKQARLVEIISKVPGTAIVYCRSRRRTQEMASLLGMHGISADYYHAGLNTKDRSKKQQDWITNKIRVIVCTNAFGMGIDKPDVRLVVHMDVPECLENYYQEAGRAGRDGKKSYAVLLYQEKDLQELSLMHELRYPAMDYIREVYQSLVNFLQVPLHADAYSTHDFDFDVFYKNFKLESVKALFALKALETDGWIEMNEQSMAPATTCFHTTKKGLYAFQESHPEHEPLLTCLLRTYAGIFDYPAYISEKMIAGLLRKDEAQIKEELLRIHSFGIISYAPRKEVPQIRFLKNRVAVANLAINMTMYEKRKENFVRRAKQMIAFAGTTDCRSMMIGKYFGDADAGRCGICDQCLQKRSQPLSGEEFERIAGEISNLLASSPKTIKGLMTDLGHVKKEKAWQVIEFLQAEQKIRADANGLLSVARLK
jgi:ATP-dependent DNA helicase RecQ